VTRLAMLAAPLLFASSLLASEGPLKSGTFDPPRMAPEFTLQGSDGTQLEVGRLRGKVVALAFGYTHCPEICPTTLAKLAKARKALGTQGRDLQVVYVTVDPERDDPATMRAFLASFDASFLGGSGSAAQLQGVYKDYGVLVKKWPGKGPHAYGVEHSTFVLLIDREGRLRAMVPYGKSAEDIAHDARELLKQ
jgi:protein SCO1/2